MSATIRFAVLGLMAGALVAAAGCGGRAAPAGGSSPDGTVRTAPPPIDQPPPPITTDQGTNFRVTVQTSSGLFTVDKLEVEFNKRRGLHYITGFYRDQWDQMTTIPFRDIQRIEFFGPMPTTLFEQAIIGREQMNLYNDNAFGTRVFLRNGDDVEFFAFIPKLRGEKDLVLWEFPMNSNNNAISYIDFDNR